MIDLSAWMKRRLDVWQQGNSCFAGGNPPLRFILTLGALAAVCGLALAPLTPSGLPNGDAALYAQQAMALDFSQRTVHAGYFGLVALLTGFSDEVPDRVFNVISILGACATIILIGLMTVSFTQRRDLGLLAALSLLGSYTFIRNAVWAEIYIFQAFFFLLACWLFWRAKPLRSGAALALSVMISPSMLLGVPGLCAGRPRLRDIVKLGLMGGGLVLLCLAFFWRDFFFGARGLLGAVSSSPGLVAAVIKEGFELLYGPTMLLPFLMIGVVRIFERARLWPFLAALGTLWLPTLIFGERFADVPVQLPTWILLAPVLALGVEKLEILLEASDPLRRRGVMLAASLVSCLPLVAIPVVARRARTFAALSADSTAMMWTVGLGTGALAVWLAATRPRLASRVAFLGWLIPGTLLAALLVGQGNREVNIYRQDVLALREVSPGEYLAVGSWEQGILLEHYLHRSSYTGRTVQSQDLTAEAKVENGEVWARTVEAMESGHAIWLLQEAPVLDRELKARGWRRQQVGSLELVTPPDAPGVR